jgi:hypothetical protein
MLSIVTPRPPCQADEAAERHRVEQAEPPGIGVAEDGDVTEQRLRWRLIGAVLGQNHEDDQRQRQRDQGEAEDARPGAQRRGEHGREQRGEGGAAVAGPGDAHGQPLMLRRIPAAGQRQRRGEAGPRDAEQSADEDHVEIAVRPQPRQQ